MHSTTFSIMISMLLLLLTIIGTVHGFTTPFFLGTPVHLSRRHVLSQQQQQQQQSSGDKTVTGQDAVSFETLLRELQIEGVPILGCDAAQGETFMTATYSTMAQMSESDEASQTCLVLENLPIDAINGFVDDFTVLKMQPRLMMNLPEFERFYMEVLGTGTGPTALLITAAASTPQDIERKKHDFINYESKVTSESAMVATKAFVDRMIVKTSPGGTCPYTKTAEIAPLGLETKGIDQAQIGYRFGGKSDAINALASFWTCVCELQNTPANEISTIVLSLPCVGPDQSPESHEKFATVMEVVSRSLCLFRGDSLFGLVHFHPSYDRTTIFPDQQPSYGHLPPRDWLRAMMKMNGDNEEAESFTDEQISLSDYQRRSPHTAINILRAGHIAAAAGPKGGIVDLDLGNGKIVTASGISTYSRNVIRLGSLGREILDICLQQEVEMTWS